MSFTSLSTLLFRLFSQPQGYSQELYNLTTIIPYKRGKKVEEEEEERHRPAVLLKIPSSIVPRHVPLALNSQRVLVCCSVYGQCNRKTSVKFFFFAESHTFQMCFFFSGVTHKEKLCFDRGRIQSDFDFSPLKLFKGQRRDQRVIRDLVAAQRRKKISTETSSRVF